MRSIEERQIMLILLIYLTIIIIYLVKIYKKENIKILIDEKKDEEK